MPYPEVIVPARVIIEREPDTIRTFVDRIRYRTVRPFLVGTAVGGASEGVEAFCPPPAPPAEEAIAAPDSTAAPPAAPPRVLLRSGTFKSGWWLGGDHLLLTGPTSNGDLRSFDFNMRGDFSFRTSADSVIVRYPRTWFVKDVIEFSGPLVLGFAVAKMLGG